MMKINFLAALLIAGFLNAPGQVKNSIPTQSLADDLKKLIALNSFHGGSIDFSGQEAVNLEENATTAQLIELTAPYLNSEIINAKRLCIFLLSSNLFKKAKDGVQRQELVEIICKNYLTTDTEVQTIDNVLLQMKEKDFTANAKKYIAALIDSMPKFCYGCCAQLSAIAQVKENIPALWKIARKDIATMERADIDVLASLARMGEKEAGSLLCNYYGSEWNKRERQGVVIKSYVSFAKQLAFSLDSTVLACLISDFRNFDMNLKDKGNDYFWWPARHLGIQITDMLRNYPYPKDYKLDPYQLLGWLNGCPRYELAEK